MEKIEKSDVQPKYKRGIETQNRIYQCAKKLFYEIGYKKATIEKIAAAAEVPQGLVTYYYKKDSILSQIYADYMKSIVYCIEDSVGVRLENHLQKHLLINQIFYSCLIKDPKNKEVYREIFIRRLISDEVHTLINSNLTNMIQEFKLAISDDFFQKLVLAEFGARRELLFFSYDKLHPVEDKSFYYFLGSITGRLAGIEPAEIEKNIQTADRLLTDVDTSDICFLVPNFGEGLVEEPK